MKRKIKIAFLILIIAISSLPIVNFYSIIPKASAATTSFSSEGITVSTTTPSKVTKNVPFKIAITLKNDSLPDEAGKEYIMRTLIGPYSEWSGNMYMYCNYSDAYTAAVCNQSTGFFSFSFTMPAVGNTISFNNFSFYVSRDADPELIVRTNLWQIYSASNNAGGIVYSAYLADSILDGAMEDVLSDSKITSKVSSNLLTVAFRGNDNRIHTKIIDIASTSNPKRSTGWYSGSGTTSLRFKNDPSLTAFNSKIILGVVGSADNGIYTRWHTPGINDPVQDLSSNDYASDYWTQYVKNGKTPNNITMEEFNASLYQAVKGNSTNDIYTRKATFSAAGGYLVWSDWTANGRTPGNITMKVFNGKLYQAVKGNDPATNLIYTRYTNDGINWSAWTSDGRTPGDITMEVYNGRLYQSVKGNSSPIIYTRYTVDGFNWTQWVPANNSTPGVVDMEVVGNRLYQTARSTDNKIITRYTSNGDTWSNWESFSATNKDVTLASNGTTMYQVYVGSNGKPYVRSMSKDANYVWGGATLL